MSFRIAIVEDIPEEAILLQSYLERYGKEQNLTFLTEVFSTAEAFLVNYRPVYDLVMMDICLPHSNGMDAARELRRMDAAVALVFVTSMKQFAIEGYEVDALDFMVKPVSYSAFLLKMPRVLAHMKLRSQAIIVTSDSEKLRINVSDILYAEVHGHDMLIHTTEGNIHSYGNLRQLEEKVDPGTFARCNSCYLVNLEYVRCIKADSAIVGEDELTISRPKHKEFVRALNVYLGGI